MKKITLLLVVVILMSLFTAAFSQISADDAVPVIERKGILSNVNEDALTYDEFHAAIAKAFPGKESLIKTGSGEVLRLDFITDMVAVLGLEEEAAGYEEAYAMSMDIKDIPQESVGVVSVAYRSNHQLLDNLYGGFIAPFKPISKINAARSIYQAMYPPKRGGTVVTAVGADPAGFNTLFTSAGLTWTIGNIIGDGLTTTDENGFYTPRLVKEMPSIENGLIKMNEDGTVDMKFELRKGIKWHDGEEVTAHDVKFQWEVMISEAPVTSNYYEKSVSDVEIIDDYTYVLHFNQPAAGMEYGSSEYAYYFGWFQLPEHVFRADFEKAKETGNWEEFSGKVTNNPVMCGAFKLKEYIEGQRVVFEAFDGYFMGRPNIDEIVMRVIPDSDSIFASTLNGEIDVGRYTLDLKQSIQLMKQKSDIYQVYLTPNVAYQCINLNFRDPEDLSKPNQFFGDNRVRQAVLYGINRDQLNKIVFFGKAEVVDTWITENHMMREALSDPRIKHYEYNPQKAIQLLNEAGWKKGPSGFMEKDGKVFEFDLIIGAGSSDAELMGQILQGMLKGIGLKVKIDQKPSLVMWTEINPYGKFDAVLTGWGYGVNGEALNFWGTDSIPSEANGFGGTNYTGWSNSKNDEILKEMAVTIEYDRKLELYTEHFALWTEDLATIPLVSDPTPHFGKKYIKSFSSTYNGGLGWAEYYWYIDKDQH